MYFKDVINDHVICMSVCLCMSVCRMCAIPVEARRGCQVT